MLAAQLPTHGFPRGRERQRVADHGPRAATIVADTPMHLLVLDPRSFVSLLDDVPSVSRKIMRVLAERLREMEKAPTA